MKKDTVRSLVVAAVVDDDKAAVAQLCRRISALLSERNRLCRLNKK